MFKILRGVRRVVIPEMRIADLHDRNLVIAVILGVGSVLSYHRGKRKKAESDAE
jgi:hypothetical protein